MDEGEGPRNVKDLLAEAKDVSELMVDLAYAAVFFNDEKLAKEVERLQRELAWYLRKLRQLAMLAARSPEDAEKMSDVLHIAAAMEKMGDAASAIARVIHARLGIPRALRPDLRHADEIVGRVRVRKEAAVTGRSLRELRLPGETGMWLLAIRRGEDWTFGPDADTAISGGDVLLYQGPEEGVNPLRALVGAPSRPDPPPHESPALTDLDRAVDILVEMKNSAEVAVGLAYSCLLLQEPALAAEVASLEARSDTLRDEMESWVLKSAPGASDTDELRGLLRLASAGEMIFGAARDMTWPVEQGDELHPVIAMALEATEEVAAETRVDAGSQAQGRSLKDLALETETGMSVLAIQRGRRWIYRPRAFMTLEAGDRLISIGPEEGAGELATICRAGRPRST